MENLKWEIIPDTDENEDDSNLVRLSFTYLHGKLQRDAETDLYSIKNFNLKTRHYNKFVDSDNLQEGLYPCIYKGNPCTLFFWKYKLEVARGLIVYDSDEKGLLHAELCYKTKTGFL